MGCTVLTGDAKGIRTVLQKSNGVFLPGEFVAILGPSGAGESQKCQASLGSAMAAEVSNMHASKLDVWDGTRRKGTYRLQGNLKKVVPPAGKSTMLDVLAGRKYGKGVEGVITLNDHVMTRELSNRCISYVGQEDVFMPTLSAWESLLFVSQLCMAPAPKAEHVARMNAVLEQMGLTKVKYSKVCSLPPSLALAP